METTNHTPLPAGLQVQPEAAPHLIIAPFYRDEKNGAVYVHHALTRVVEPWADAERTETHIPPITTKHAFGDVESFADYVTRYGVPSQTLVRWNAGGLVAVLDYHHDDRTPGRCQWQVSHAFTPSHQLAKWQAAIKEPVRQKDLVEFLEDMAETVVQPKAADLAGILRTLRASVGQKADSELREDGSYKVVFSKDAQIKAEGTIPPTFIIRLPVLAGHVNADGRAVTYDLTVRLRVTPTENGAVFRLSIPNLIDTLEHAYADRVATAQAALGVDYPILRAAD